MPSCAFLSISQTEGWFIDDDLCHEPLRALGWDIRNVPWDAEVNWNEFDLVVIRSTWDYQSRMEPFLKVLEAIDQSQATLLNPLALVKWNIDKHYLVEFEEQDIEVVPTLRLQGLSSQDLHSAFDSFATDTLILKPMVGANSDDTFRLQRSDEADFPRLEKLFQDRACMIQPFMQHIVEEGEYSLIYFNGELSHTILKQVGKGDFRVQEEHGGQVAGVAQPEPGLLAAADKVMQFLGEAPLYARVDLVRTAGNGFALMEIELIEPSLYLRCGEGAPEAFAKAIDAVHGEG